MKNELVSKATPNIPKRCETLRHDSCNMPMTLFMGGSLAVRPALPLPIEPKARVIKCQNNALSLSDRIAEEDSVRLFAASLPRNGSKNMLLVVKWAARRHRIIRIGFPRRRRRRRVVGRWSIDEPRFDTVTRG